MGNAGVGFRIDPGEFNRLANDLQKFDPALKKELRASMKDLGKPASEEIKKTLREPSPGGGDNSGEGRAALIAATREVVSFSRSGAGLKIVTSANRLPAAHKGLLNAYNKTSFRHPVFGSDTYVTQPGRPYFRSSIYRVLDKDLQSAMAKAVERAVDAIGGRTK